MRIRDRLPSLDLLKAFEAAAKHLSFTKAGEALSLSQSAVSRQIQQLEDQLGAKLFLRRTRALLLTDAGQRYSRDVGRIFEQLREATARVRAGAAYGTVTVTTSVTFASLWLVPRLGNFQELNPAINVHVAADNALSDLDRDRLDVSIRYSTRRLAGREAVKLFGERVVPVCSPGLLAKGSPSGPEDLAKFTLIHFEDPVHEMPWLSWGVWFEVMKAKPVSPGSALRVSHYDHVIRAALDGQGIALGRLPLIEGLLQEGKLVMPLRDLRFRTDAADRAYWLLVSQTARSRRDVLKFIEWVHEQAGVPPKPGNAT